METLHVIDQVFWLMIIRHITKKLPTCINNNGGWLRQNFILIGTIFNVPRPAHNLTLYCTISRAAERYTLRRRILYSLHVHADILNLLAPELIFLILAHPLYKM